MVGSAGARWNDYGKSVGVLQSRVLGIRVGRGMDHSMAAVRPCLVWVGHM